MAKGFNSVDEFIGHQSGQERRGGKYMRSWKKNGKSPNGGSLAVWLLTRQLPVSVWMHQFPRMVVKDDPQTRIITKNYYMSDYVCWEDEEVLKRMYQRDANGQREFPPQRCPICKLLEMLYQAIAAGDISSFDEVFRFEGATDPQKNIVLHAGGMLNLWRQDKMSDLEKHEMASRGLSFRTAWKESCAAKNNYVICLVQQEDLASGVQIDTEPGILGDKLKGMINDQIASKASPHDPDAGNPFKKPYCIEFVYDESKTDFKEKYRVRPLERYPLTEQIKQLIYGDPPSLSYATSAFNGQSMRAVMERHRQLDVPWDEIFSEPQPAGGSDEDFPGPEGDHATQTPQAPPANTAAASTAVETEPCPTILPSGAPCAYPLRTEETKCPKCGTEFYAPGEEPTPQAPPPPLQYVPLPAPQQAHVSSPAVQGPPTAQVQFQPPAAAPPPMRSIGGKTRGGPQAPRKPGEPL